MDKYKIELTKDGKWAVKTKNYFWQRWRPYTTAGGKEVIKDTIDDAFRAIGIMWWKEVIIRVNAIGVW